MTCDACGADLTNVDHRLVLKNEPVNDEAAPDPLLTTVLRFCSLGCLDMWGAGRLRDLLNQDALCSIDPEHGFTAKIIGGIPLCADCAAVAEATLANRLRDLADRIATAEPDEVGDLREEMRAIAAGIEDAA